MTDILDQAKNFLKGCCPYETREVELIEGLMAECEALVVALRQMTGEHNLAVIRANATEAECERLQSRVKDFESVAKQAKASVDTLYRLSIMLESTDYYRARRECNEVANRSITQKSTIYKLVKRLKNRNRELAKWRKIAIEGRANVDFLYAFNADNRHFYSWEDDCFSEERKTYREQATHEIGIAPDKQVGTSVYLTKGKLPILTAKQRAALEAAIVQCNKSGWERVRVTFENRDGEGLYAFDLPEAPE